MIELVVSGGQTGADQGGWRAAKAAGIPTTGWMPKGFKTEAGCRPDFADLYGAKAHRSASYRDRTISNVGLADATVIFNCGGSFSPGTKLALSASREVSQPVLIVGTLPDIWIPSVDPEDVWAWIRRLGVRSLNVAGNRESSAPGIGVWVEGFMAQVFRHSADGFGPKPWPKGTADAR